MAISRKIVMMVAETLSRRYGSQTKAGNAIGLAQQTVGKAAKTGRGDRKTVDALLEEWTRLGLGPSKEFFEAAALLESHGVTHEAIDEVSAWPIAKTRDSLAIIQAISSEVLRKRAMTG